MTFAEYYRGHFRDDITDVIAALPTLHEHEDAIVIQPRSVSKLNRVVRRWPIEQRMLFGSALFLTALTDQVCYTYFRELYPRFRELTMYPKWRGDCPGGCSTNMHPGLALHLVGARAGAQDSLDPVAISTLPDDLWSTMREEVVDFVQRYLPGANPEEFWSHCEREIPVEFRCLYTSSRRAG